MEPKVARDFRVQLQEARENAHKDAEGFDCIIHAVERLGSYLLGKVSVLGKYKPKLHALATKSPLAADIPSRWRGVHTPFDILFEIVRDARNDAMHIGATARHLTAHAIELALILKDALRMSEAAVCVSDYMVRDPLCAHLWQPISIVRQRMLANSFSYLPVQGDNEKWSLVSDLQVAKYLRNCSTEERKKRLSTPLEKATEIELTKAICLMEADLLETALKHFDSIPILIVRNGDRGKLTGILTAFDIL